MNNELIGVISNEGELEGVLEDNSFNVKVQIMESGPRGLQGPKGEKGEKGEQGEVGPQGEQGIQGEKGDPFVYEDFTVEQLANLKGDKGEKGDKGDTGEKGEKGTDGKDGYTPQKGVDYYTDDDKAEMVSAVIAALPVYEGEVESV